MRFSTGVKPRTRRWPIRVVSLLGVVLVAAACQPEGSLDHVVVTPNGVLVEGWAHDPDADTPIAVHLYADGVFVGELEASLADGAYGPPRDGRSNARFSTNLSLDNGSHQVCAYGIDIVGGDDNALIGCKPVEVTGDPLGSVQTSPRGDQIVIDGWVIDPDSAGPLQIHVYVDGRFVTAATADIERADTARLYPNAPAQTGFLTFIPDVGDQVCVYAINVGAGSNVPLTCTQTPNYSDRYFRGLGLK